MGIPNNPSEILYEEIKSFTGCKPKGGQDLQQKFGRFLAEDNIRLFVPWAATADGRTELSGSDRQTLDWLFTEGGLMDRISKFGNATCLMMFADTYARRNAFDMDAASEYWANVSSYVPPDQAASFTATSVLEDAQMETLKAQKSYAFEQLDPEQRRKILEAAAKYSGAENEAEIYESAAQYSMLRAAEAAYVDTELDAAWVSLNWPERDIMCGDTPRVYVPESIRAPWLKGA